MTNLQSESGWDGPSGSPGSLERLCSVSLRACQLMNPLIDEIYQQLVSSNESNNCAATTEKSNIKKSKQDNSAFTIADGMVQRLLINVLFSQVAFCGIVGEEDEDDNDGDVAGAGSEEWWFQIQGLSIPEDLKPLVESTKSEIQSLTDEYLTPETKDYEHITVFIDPIDGTREFSSGKGEQCSVCIGFANEQGKAVGGVVYRPLSQPKPTWVAGAVNEGYAASDFGEEKSSSNTESTKERRVGLLTTNGSISPFAESLIEELQMERVKSGGAGNKMMMLLESSISGGNSIDDSRLYIQDRGVSRWDTCAAEACLEAFGGKLMKLTHLLETNNVEDGQNNEFYTYLASQTNLDFIPGSANLTKQNCRSMKDLQPNQMVLDVDQVKAYSNLCGLVAIGKEWNTETGLAELKKAIESAATKNPPSLN